VGSTPATCSELVGLLERWPASSTRRAAPGARRSAKPHRVGSSPTRVSLSPTDGAAPSKRVRSGSIPDGSAQRRDEVFPDRLLAGRPALTRESVVRNHGGEPSAIGLKAGRLLREQKIRLVRFQHRRPRGARSLVRASALQAEPAGFDSLVPHEDIAARRAGRSGNADNDPAPGPIPGRCTRDE
jgi:hypothetical protein